MNRLANGAWTGGIVYEFRMATRRRVVWLAVLPLLLLAVLVQLISPAEADTASARMGAWALTFNMLVTVGLGVALADRFAGTARRGLNELLMATPSSVSARMFGSLAGSLAAALAPVAAALLVVAAVVTATTGEPATLGWAVLAFLAIIVPSATVLTTFSATIGLVLPNPLVRVLAVGVWFWATLFSTAILPLPTITGTLLSPLGDYIAGGWLHAPTLWAGEGPVDALSPAPSAASAAINLGLVLLMSLGLFGGACALARRRL